MWVMITGITNVDDALTAWNLGADALGLLVEHASVSKASFISPKVATSITKSLSPGSKSSPSFSMETQQDRQGKSFSSLMDHLNELPNSPARLERFCASVLVTHLIDVQKIIDLASITGVTTIQLAGNATPKDAIDIKNRLPYIKIIKSLQVVDNSCMEYVKKYMHAVDAIELDTIDTATDKIGGTGKTHDWNISQKIVQEYGYKVPIILAGGLHADNIEEAIQTVKPFGVDVSSGVKDIAVDAIPGAKNSRSIQNEKLALFISKAKKAKSF